MGLVIKKPISAQQLAEQIQNAETQAALDNINLAIKDERNARSSEDINLRRDINFLQETLTEEISARTAAENIIKADLLTETNQRTAADSTLQAAIDAEKSARETENSNLRDEINTAIDNEKAERAQALNDLNAAISVAMGNAQRLQEIENENLRRQMEADAASQGTTLAALNDRVTTEEQTRAAEDTRLANAISAEESARQTAVSNLQSTLTNSLTNETTARQNADSQLQTAFNSAIATETQNRTNALNTLDTSLKGYVNTQIAGVEENLNDFTSPTSTAAGKRGLVPAPPKGLDVKILTSNGWRPPDDATLTISVIPSQVGSLTYSGSSQTPTWLNFDNKKLSVSGETSGTDAKTYTVTFTPLDLYMWADTLDQQPKSATWKIEPLKLAKPTAAVTTFTFNNAAQGISVSNFDSTYESQTGTVSATNVNSYSATYKLKNTSNTKWSDNSTSDVVINWKIEVLKLTKPTAAVTEFQHDGNTKNLAVSNFNSTYENQTGTVSASAVGTYSAVYSLKNTTNTKWADNSTGNVTINWEIKQSVLSAAQSSGFAQVGTLTYNGNSQNVSIQNYDANYHSLSGTTSAVNAGNYTAKISPKSGCTWADGTNSAKDVNWTIKPMTLQKPVAATTSFDYDGYTKTLSVSNYNSAYMTQSGTTSASEAGEYQVTYSLNSTSNYVWADNSTSNVVINWGIGSLSLPKPTAATTSFTYNGSTKTLSVQNYNSNYMTQTGTISETSAGNYSVKYHLINTARAKWSDGSTSDITINWTIERKKLTATQSTFSQSGSLTFNAARQNVAITNYDANYHTLSGTTYSTAAGTFTAKVSPGSNYAWSDGNTSAKDVSWTIAQKVLTKPTAADTLFSWNNTTQSLVISNYDSTFLTQTGTVSAKNVGEYSVTYKIKAPASAHWTDNTTDDVVIDWEIEAQKLSETLSTFSQDGTLTYSGSSQTVSIKNYDSSYHTRGGTYSSTAAGNYVATITPKTGYAFNDGSTDAKEVSWSILPLSLDIPTAAETDFTYNGSTKTLSITGYNSSRMTRTGTYSASAAGNYQVTFTLKDTANTRWANGSTDPVVIDWSIGLTKVASPTLQNATFTYDGNSKEPAFNDFDSALMTASSETSAVNAGNYAIKVALKDKTRYCGTDNSTDDLIFNWVVKRKPLTATQGNLSQSGTLTYNGSSQTVTITNYSASYHNLGGAYISTNAGEYVAQVEPLPNYCWNDNTFAPKYVTWSINPIKLAKPTAAVTEFTYDKNAHALAVQNYNADYMNQTGSISATNAGSYSVVYSLKNSNNTVWADNSISNVYIAWNISKQTLAKPTLSTSSFVYNGSNRTVTVNNFNSTYMSQSGVTQAKDAGTYELTFSFNDPSLVNWEDGTNSDVTLTWKITRAAMTTARSNPYQSSIPTFTNSAKSISATYITGYYSSQQVWSGTTSATNAGEYTAYVEPNSNYTWVDGSVSKKTVKWSIAPAQISPPTVSDSVTLTYNESAQSPTLTGCDSSKMTLGGDTSKTNAGDYTLTVTLANNNYVWTDGTSEAKSLIWTIGRKPVGVNTFSLKDTTRARIESGYYAMDFYADSKTFTVGVGVNSDNYAVFPSSAFSGASEIAFLRNVITPSSNLVTNTVGIYTITFSITDSNYCWNDYSSTPKFFEFCITPAKITTQYWKGNYLILTYDGTEKFIRNYGLNTQLATNNIYTVTGTTAATAAGNYSATVSLKDKINTCWDDNTTADKTINWSIGLTKITAPTISTTYFDYDNSNKTVSISGFDSNTMTQTGTTTAKSRGFYTVTFSLKDKDTTCWSTGGNADIVIEWAIGKKRVNKPALADDAVTEFTYSGSAKTLSVTGYDADSMTQSGYLSATDAGSYTVTYALKNTTEYVWADNTTANVSFSWKINKAALAAVTFSQSGTLTYDGTAKTVTIKNYNASTMDTSSTTSATAAGTYTAKVSPKSNYTWSDGTSTAKSVSWKINKKSLTKPTAANTVFEYDGSAKSLTFSNYDSTYMTQSGTASATDSGSYTVTFTLKSTSNTQWADATTSAVNINWSIGGSYIAIPTVSPASQISKGLTQTHSVTVSGFDSSTMTQSGTVSTSTGKAATYTVTFALKDKTNTAWADGTTTNKAVSWTVTKKVLTAAESTFAQNKSVSYDGNSHSVTEACTAIKSAYIGEYYTLSNATGTNAGSFTSSITPTTAATWNDSTTAAKNIEWTITGAAPTLNLSSTDVTLTLSANTTYTTLNNARYTQTITFTTNSDGDITISSANEFVAAPRVVGFTGAYTIAASSGSFRIYPVANGETTFTISQAAGTGHAAISKTIKVKVVTARVFLTWAQIASLTKSGTLTNYMRIGDCATIGTLTGTVGIKTLNDIAVARLIGFNHNSSIEGVNRAHFAVFLGSYANANSIIFDDDYGKNTSNGAADNSFIFYPTYDATYLATHSRDYSVSSLRTRCTEFFNILPTALQNVITTCKKYDYGNSRPVEDKIWIPSAWEITGNHLPSTVEQYEYWANGNSKAFNSKNYWARSVWSTNNGTSILSLDRNVYIDSSGSYELTNSIHTSYGFLPCFTIS